MDKVFLLSGLLALVCLLLSALSGWLRLKLKWHRLLALLALVFALVHAGLWAYFNFFSG
ncbi:MAG TPA: hypothetical protein PKN80_04430 [bacterium]|uniref:Uncharacterized protein n=1 Tax=candidate division TA06 bacterium ADurb.Bin417 TaxID=1852828 RepID=A0A1V5MDY1_UNCT6|nr:MAG: hypothetical protein BWY73_01193 [candidate division TA06 bacterium ADurb.Bin417]HNQ35293.1 hypothetical protein [bacterium]HNS48404.1 hypothetical protein [bacterium]